MGLRVIVGREAGTETESAVLFCSTSGVCFGKRMASEDDAEAFLAWAAERGVHDLRRIQSHEVVEMQNEWQGSR